MSASPTFFSRAVGGGAAVVGILGTLCGAASLALVPLRRVPAAAAS